MNFEVLKSLWISWQLLLGSTIAVAAIWLFPSSWIFDAEVVNVREQYRGYIGFGAACLIILVFARGLVSLGEKSVSWYQGRSERKRIKTIHERNLQKVLRRVRTLKSDERALLCRLVKSNTPKVTLDARDPRADQLWRCDLLECVHCEFGDVEHVYQVPARVWSRLRKDRSILKRTKPQPSTEKSLA